MKSSPSDASPDIGPASAGETDTPLAELSVHNLLWPILLSLVAFATIAWFTYEPNMLEEMWTRLNPLPLLAAGAMVVGRVFFGSLRLYFMSHKHMPYKETVRGQLAWDFASNVTPSAIGGAPIAAMFVCRESDMQVGEATAVFLFSMLLDQIFLASMIPILMLGSVYIGVYPEALGFFGDKLLTLFFLAMLTWIGLLIYATLVRPDVLEKITNKLFRLPGLKRFQSYVQEEMVMLQDRSALLRSESLRFFLGGYVLTALMWLCRMAVLLFVIWSVYDALPQLQIFLRTIAMMLSSLVVITPGASGGIEGLYALFIAPLIPTVLVAPTLLTWRLLNYYLFVAVGLVISTRHVRKVMTRSGDTGSAPKADETSEDGDSSVPQPVDDPSSTPNV